MAVTLFTGCAAQPAPENEENNTPPTSETTSQPLINPNDPLARFENDQFTLNLPGPVDKSIPNGIVPQNEEDFERIFFDIEQKPEGQSILQVESEKNRALCDETDACPVMANSADVTIDGAEGIKYETNMLGRAQDDPEGETFGFYYALEKDGQYYRFWTTTTDLGNPEQVRQTFDEVLATLTFKEG